MILPLLTWGDFMQRGVTKGDMCKATRGNLLSSYVSILLCQHKGAISEKQFLTDLYIDSSPMYSLAKAVGVDDLLDLFIDCLPKIGHDENMSTMDKKVAIRNSFIDRSIHNYEDVIVEKIKEYERKEVDVYELNSIGELKLYVLCFDRKYLSNIDSVFKHAINNYGMDKANIAHDIDEVVKCYA